MRTASILFALGAAALAIGACGTKSTSVPIAAEAGDDDAAATMPAVGADPDADVEARDAAEADAPMACPSDVVKLTNLLNMSACGQCTLVKCPQFKASCFADCNCTDAVLTLLTCVTIGNDVQQCQSVAAAQLSTNQLNEYIECNGTCGQPCSDKTFFLDAGDGGDAADASDASDAADGDEGDASDGALADARADAPG